MLTSVQQTQTIVITMQLARIIQEALPALATVDTKETVLDVKV